MPKKYKSFKKLKYVKKTKKKAGPNHLVLSRPGQVIPRSAYATFRGNFKMAVNASSASTGTDHVYVKGNSLYQPFFGVVGTDKLAVTGFASTDNLSGAGNWIGTNNQLYGAFRALRSTIRVKCCNLGGYAYNVTVVPIVAGVTKTYKQASNMPNSKEMNFATIYTPGKLTNTMSVAKMAGVSEKDLMGEVSYYGSVTQDPSTQFGFLIVWQSADASTNATKLVFEIELDVYGRMELPNFEDIS